MGHQVGIHSQALMGLHAHNAPGEGGKLTLFTDVFTNVEVPLPIGVILPWIPGNMTNGANAGYQYRLGAANTIAAANAYLNPYGWHVCDGSLLNDPDSPIFNGAGRYLPNLVDSRFLRGKNSSGTPQTFGWHEHDKGTLAGSQPNHQHAKGTLAGSQPSHNHPLSGDTGNQDNYHYHDMSDHTHLVRDVEPGNADKGSDGPIPTNTGNEIGNHKHPKGTLAVGNNGDDAVSIAGSVANDGNDPVTISGKTAAPSSVSELLTCLYIMRVK